mgnify:CR=1 FL=1
MTLGRLTLLPQRDAAEVAVTPILPSEPELPPVEDVSVARMAKGGRWRTEAMRSYDRPVLIWFTRGQGRLSVAGRRSGYSPHNLVFLPAKTMHGFSASGPVLGSVVFLSNAPDFDWPVDPLHLRLQQVQVQRELTGMIDAIQAEAASGCSHSNRALLHHVGLLSVWLARTADAYDDAAQGAQATQIDTSAHRLTRAFTSLVERDFRKTDGVQHYAALLGVTPTHLTRVCRKVSGRPALDILTDRRHFEAKRLLRDSKIQIAEIARQCGFSSPAYFTRAFRAHTGNSPSEFRSSS